MVWSFTLYIKDLAEFSDEQTDALFEAGCSDGSLASGEGQAWIGFDREASSLQDAIRSAVSDVRRTGLDVEHVEIEAEELADSEIAHWQTV